MTTPMTGGQSANRRKLRLAFLGGACGSAVGRVHRTAIEMDQRFALVAGCFSRDPTKNLASGLEYGLAAAHVHDSFESLLSCAPAVFDAIVLLTPTDQHHEQVLRCLERGIPVICEKALATTVGEVAAITARQQAGAGFLAVTYNYTGYPMLRELRAMVGNGVFGRIRQINVEMPQDGFIRRAPDGSPLVPQAWRLRDGEIPTISLDLGVHLHMLVNFVCGGVPLEVAAHSDSHGNFPVVIDTVSSIVTYSSGVVCNQWFSKSAQGYRNGLKIRIFGERGSAEWLQENPEYLQVTDAYGTRSLLDRGSGNILVAAQPRYTRFKVGHPAGFIEAFANYYVDIADALEARMDGREPANPYVFGTAEALEGMRLLDAIALASRERRWVKVAEAK